MEGAEHGFTFDNSDGNVGWHWVTGQQAVSGSGALYYGNPANLNYNSGSFSENTGTATGPSVFLTPGVDAVFSAKVWMETESSSYYDKLFIYLEYQKEDESCSKLGRFLNLRDEYSYFHAPFYSLLKIKLVQFTVHGL